MPELPEVETVVRTARPRLVGRRIVAFRSFWERQVSPDVASVQAALRGATIAAVSRRGKFIVITLRRAGRPAGALLIHLRMSGRFEWRCKSATRRAVMTATTADDNRSPAAPAHTRAIFDFDDGSRLHFCDARKFGRIRFLAEFDSDVAGLGLEPLDRAFSPEWLTSRFAKRKRMLKPLLLDQSVIAGLGNIYTDEALFRARLHPLRRASSLRRSQIAALHEAIQHVLREGIRHNGTSLDWIYPDGRMQDFLMVYGRDGEPCRRCGDTIVTFRVGQRGTHVCPTCQPRGREKNNAAVQPG